MARTITNIRMYLTGNPETDPLPDGGYIVYDIVEGKASKEFVYRKIEKIEEKLEKVFHAEGEVGEFWRDEIDLIKADENML